MEVHGATKSEISRNFCVRARFHRTMKHSTLTMCVALAALLAIPSTTLAQGNPAGEGACEGAGRHGARPTPEELIKRMTETLGLSQDQQDEIKAIYEKNSAAIKELMAKGFQNLTEEDMTKMRKMMKSQFEKLSAVLTPEQKEKLKAEMEKRRGKHRPK
jgi:Spy/CpxP family protein refolding chaperone